MGSAILKGILSAGLADADEVICSCHSSETKSRLEEMYKVAATRDNLEVAKNADLTMNHEQLSLSSRNAQEFQRLFTRVESQERLLCDILGADKHRRRAVALCPH